MISPAERAQLTFRMERWRSVFGGIIETAGNTFLLLIATRVFDLGPWAKALIAAGTSVGLLLSPLVVNAARNLGLQPSRAVSGLLGLGGLSCLLVTLVPHPVVYTVGCVFALLTSTCAIPLMTQIYHDNYPADQRGRLFTVNNNAPSAYAGSVMKAMGVVAGVSDMIYLSAAGAVFLEFKDPKGKQSLSQKWWRGVVQEAG